MKKLYRKGTVHPSPPIITDQLSFLPATILTLTAALSPEDREVLAYLISCSSNNSFSTPPFIINNNNFFTPRTKSTSKNGAAAKGASGVDHGGDHPPLFNCSCFRCYMTYWVRWDSSPNRQLIHEIIDAFEDWLVQSNKGSGKNSRKDKRNKKGAHNNKLQSAELKRSELMTSSGKNESDESELVRESSGSGNSSGDGIGERGGVEDEEKGSVRRFVSFIGERIWGAWGQ